MSKMAQKNDFWVFDGRSDYVSIDEEVSVEPPQSSR
jgi:hypothetical protein